MAAYIPSSSTPKINWAAQDMSLEYLNFEDMCEMMFYGPLAEHKDNDKAKFSYMSLWGGPKALELLHNSAFCNQKTSKNYLRVLKENCCKDTSVKSNEKHFNTNDIEKQQNDTDSDFFSSEDNEYFVLSCNKGTFEDEICDTHDNESPEDVNAKSDFDDLSANINVDDMNMYLNECICSNSPSSTSSNENSVSGDIYSDNLLVSEDIETSETDHGNLLVSGDIDNDHCSHDDFLVNGDTSDDHNQSDNDELILCKDDSDFLGSGDHIQSDRDNFLDNHDNEPMLDNSDMDFLGKSGKSGSAKDDIKFLPDQFNGVRHLQSECEHNLLSHDTDFLGSGNESINIVTSISNYDNPHEGNLNFLGSGDSTLVQAVVPMKGLDVCLMEEDNLALFVDEQLCNLRDFIVNDWPNSKTDIPVSKLCHWFLQDELGYYSGVLMKGS